MPEPEYSVQGYAYATLQCHLVKGMLEFNNMGYAGKSKVPSMKKARLRLDVTRNGA